VVTIQMVREMVVLLGKAFYKDFYGVTGKN
jgi:hypothetical protein